MVIFLSVFTVQRYCHLPIAENTVLLFIKLFYPCDNLLVYLLAVARVTLYPLVVRRTVQMNDSAYLFYTIFFGVIQIFDGKVNVFLSDPC
jgi:hypothetical protein